MFKIQVLFKTSKNLLHFFPHEAIREWQTDSGDYFFFRHISAV